MTKWNRKSAHSKDGGRCLWKLGSIQMGKRAFLSSLLAQAFNSPVFSQAGMMSASEEWNAGLQKKSPIGSLPRELLA